MNLEDILKKIKTEPENADLYFFIACEYEKMEKLDECLAALYKAKSLGFNESKVLLDIGRILRVMGDHDGSVRILEQARRTAPDSPALILELARTYEKVHDYEKAATLIIDAKSKGQVSGSDRIDLARILDCMGKKEEAEKEFRDIIAMDPANEQGYMGLAGLMERDHRYDEVIETYKQAVLSGVDNAEIHACMGMIYERTADYEAAVYELQRAVDAELVRTDVFFSLATAKYHLGQKDEAADLYRRALEIDPDFAAAYEALGTLFEGVGNDKAARLLYEEALAKVSEPALFNARIAMLLERQDMLDACFEKFESALNAGYDTCELRKSYALAFYKIGDYDSAAREFERVLAGDPHDTVSGGYLGRIYLEKGEFSGASDIFLKVLEKDPHNSLIHMSLGDAYYYSSRIEDAANEYKKALDINEDAAVLERLAKVYHKLSRFDEYMETVTRLYSVKYEQDLGDNENFVSMLESKYGSRSEWKNIRAKIIRMPIFKNRYISSLNYSILFPLGVAQICRYLRINGIDVEQDDLNVKLNHYVTFEKGMFSIEVFSDTERILEYVRGNPDSGIESLMDNVSQLCELSGYDVIMMSVPEEFENSSAIMFVLAFAAYIKKKTASLIIAGGFDFLDYDFFRENGQSIDILVKGEGEKALFRILKSMSAGASLREIPGIEFKDGSRLVCHDYDVWFLDADFNGLPCHLYTHRSTRDISIFDDDIKPIMEEFNSSSIRIAMYKMIRDCPYSCIFCSYSGETIVRALDPSAAVRRMRELKEEHGLDGFFFLSDTINISKKHINRFCDEILKSELDIMWSDCARADNLDKDTLLKMRASGCVRLIYGMETASPQLMEYIEKKIGLKRLAKVLQWSSEAGIWTGLESICGFPGEKKEDLEMLVDFINANKNNIDMNYLNILSLKVGSRLFKHPGDFGIENIIDVRFDSHSRRDILCYIRHGYDEKNGMKWPDKIESMIKNYDYVLGQIEEYMDFPVYENLQLLFFLYSRLDSKKSIKHIYNKARRNISGYENIHNRRPECL